MLSCLGSGSRSQAKRWDWQVAAPPSYTVRAGKSVWQGTVAPHITTHWLSPDASDSLGDEAALLTGPY